MPTSNRTVCSLCEDGSALPQGRLEAFPGETCAQMQVDAKRDANESNCVVDQGIVGHYCGCNNPVAADTVCRLCGRGVSLPDPQKAVLLGAASGSSCIQVEFNASVSGMCQKARDTFQQDCCSGITPAPTPTSGSVTIAMRRMVIVLGAGILSGLWANS